MSATSVRGSAVQDEDAGSNDASVPALAGALRSYHREERVSFHMPGHKQRGGLHPLATELLGHAVLTADVSEMGGFDYLHAPSGAMSVAQARAAEAFGAGHSFFLVNGSTVGNLAAITAFAGEGDRVLVLRGSHRSVYAGIALAGAVPQYVPMAYSEALGDWLLAEPPARAEVPESLALIHVTRPNYYGMACDLAPYVELAKATGAILVVDEAHGSHFGLDDRLPASALSLGADIVIQSAHKTLGALTQASLLHVGRDSSVDTRRLARSLSMLQSSSPSALLTVSLDLACEHLRGDGRQEVAKAVSLSQWLRDEIGRMAGLAVLSPSGADCTKVVVDVTATGRSGFSAAEWLRRHERLNVELADTRRIVCSVTVGDSDASVGYLRDALQRLALAPAEGSVRSLAPLPPPAVPPSAMSIRAALRARTESVSVDDVVGRVCAEYVIPYPPGIPVVAPGEVLTPDVIAAFRASRAAGATIVGPDDPTLARLLVTDDRTS